MCCATCALPTQPTWLCAVTTSLTVTHGAARKVYGCVLFPPPALLHTQVVVGKGIRSTFRWQTRDLSYSVRAFFSNLLAKMDLQGELEYDEINEGVLVVPGPTVHALFCMLQSRGIVLDVRNMPEYVVPSEGVQGEGV